jgi:outer membrane protein W
MKKLTLVVALETKHKLDPWLVSGTIDFRF